MAGGGFLRVIYIIIASQMETLNTFSPARSKSVLTLVGIVTAIICSLVFFNESHSSASAETRAPKAVEISNFGKATLFVKAASIVGLFKKSI